MPKSKRDRAISLTQTKKKGLELKQTLIDEVRKCLDEYTNVFIISVFNQRNNYLKELRLKLDNSKFIFGKNKVISLAFGRSSESEYKDNMHKLCPYLTGDVGVLFTLKSKDEILKFFNDYQQPDYARSGNIAEEDLLIPAGPLDQFQHTMEPQLRQLGMHTSLVKGVVTLDVDFQVCKKGDKLTPEQARLLKLFGMKQAKFKVNVKAYWNKDGEYEILQNNEDQNNTDKNNNKNKNNENSMGENSESEEDEEDESDEDMDEEPTSKKKQRKA